MVRVEERISEGKIVTGVFGNTDLVREKKMREKENKRERVAKRR